MGDRSSRAIGPMSSLFQGPSKMSRLCSKCPLVVIDADTYVLAEAVAFPCRVADSRPVHLSRNMQRNAERVCRKEGCPFWDHLNGGQACARAASRSLCTHASLTLPHPAREVRMLKQYGAGERESELGGRFYFFAAKSQAFLLCRFWGLGGRVPNYQPQPPLERAPARPILP
jgi:hypothetical protein